MDAELDEEAVGAALGTAWLGRTFRHVAQTGSTNDDMRLWAAAGAPRTAPHGAVLFADYQSAGRGRLGRRWEAPPATSLLLSVLLRPNGWPAERGPWLTMLAGLAVAEAVEAVTGLPARLKWPNDVMLGEGANGDPWRKVCGLLLDSTLDAGGGLETAVIGIGLNVNIPREALPDAATPPTSLMAAGGRAYSRRELLVALLARLEQHYLSADAGRSPAAAWSARLVWMGQAVRVTAGAAEPLDGVAEGVDSWGRLLLRDGSGRLHALAAGDVSLRRR